MLALLGGLVMTGFRSASPPIQQDPLEKIEGRWTLQVLLCLNRGEQRFSDLRSAIPRLSANILADRLRALERAGLVERHYLPPPHASRVYILTRLATGLRPVLDALATWRALEAGMPVPTSVTPIDQLS